MQAAAIIDWVTVGDPGSVVDTTGFGPVANSDRIGKTANTSGQYVECFGTSM